MRSITWYQRIIEFGVIEQIATHLSVRMSKKLEVCFFTYNQKGSNVYLSWHRDTKLIAGGLGAGDDPESGVYGRSVVDDGPNGPQIAAAGVVVREKKTADQLVAQELALSRTPTNDCRRPSVYL